MYSSLATSVPITEAQIPQFYKDATFGVPAGKVASTESPEPGVTIERDSQFGVPHIYGDTRAETVERVLENWEKIKQQERESKDADAAKSLAHVGRGLPSMMRAEKLGEKARRAGMDWANIRDVLAKAREELDEVEQALDRNDNAGAGEELGDLMLAIANAPRFINHDAETTLRAACDKFVARFDEVSRLAASRGLDLKSMTPSEIDALWNEAKAANYR